MAQAYFYSSSAVQTQLNSGISNSALTCQVASTVGWPASFPFVIAIDYGGTAEELCTVTANSGGLLTITRGFDSTSAQIHGIGAVVRHVYCGKDANDFRIHEGNTAGVHGVAGNVVGDTDTQTLANKTLTNPTVNGATLTGTLAGGTFTGSTLTNPTINGATTSGTWSGTPTFSGNLTFSGNPNFSGSPNFTGLAEFTEATSGTDAIGISVTGDANDRLRIRADGVMSWGPGNAARDTQIFRNGVASLGVTGTIVNSWTSTSAVGLTIGAPASQGADLARFQINGAIQVRVTQGSSVDSFNATGTNPAFQAFTTAATQPNLALWNNGQINWGPGGSTAVDTSLARNGVGSLNTPGAFNVGGNLVVTGTATASNVTTNTSYTPTWGGSLTTGNGTTTGNYVRVGNYVFVTAIFNCGSTTTLAATGNLTFTLPGAVPNPAQNAVGYSYFTKTSGGSFNVATTAVTAGSGTATYFTTPAGVFSSFNTGNSAAVATGSIIVATISYLV